MQAYIGSKIILASPMSERTFRESKGQGWGGGNEDQPGYIYTSWSPKAVFEEAYRPVSICESTIIGKEDVERYQKARAEFEAKTKLFKEAKDGDEEINIGDTVRLKTGGPFMTVEAFVNEKVVCVWFQKHTGGIWEAPASHSFFQTSLQKVEPSPSDMYEVKL